MASQAAIIQGSGADVSFIQKTLLRNGIHISKMWVDVATACTELKNIAPDILIWVPGSNTKEMQKELIRLRACNTLPLLIYTTVETPFNSDWIADDELIAQISKTEGAALLQQTLQTLFKQSKSGSITSHEATDFDMSVITDTEGVIQWADTNFVELVEDQNPSGPVGSAISELIGFESAEIKSLEQVKTGLLEGDADRQTITSEGILTDPIGREGAVRLKISCVSQLCEEERLLFDFAAKEEKEGAFPSLQLFANTFDQSIDPMLITDADLGPGGTRIQYVNRAFCELTGYEPHELIGNTPRILQGERTDPEVLANLRNALEAGEPFQGETWNYRKDGSPYKIEWRITPIRNVQGEIIYFIANQRDTTAKDELQKVRIRDSAIVNSSEDAIISLDSKGVVTGWNPGAETMYGYTQEEAVGQLIDNLIISDEQAQIDYSEWLEKGSAVRGMKVNRVAKNGDELTISLNISPLYDDDGEMIGLLKVARDITEQENTRRFLAQTNETAKIGGWELDEASRTLRWTDQSYHIMGLEGKEEPSLSLFKQYVDPSFWGAISRRLLDLLQFDIPFSHQFPIISSSWEWKWVQLTGKSRIDQTSGQRKLYGTLQEITEYKQILDSFIESEHKLEALLDHMPDGVAVFEPVDDGEDFIWKKANRAAIQNDKKLGNDGDLVGKSVRKDRGGLEATGLLDVMREVLRTEQPQRVKLEIENGPEIRHYQNFIYSLPSGEVVTIFDDVTDKTELDEAVRQSEVKFRSIFEDSPVAMTVFDVDGFYMDANEQMCRFLECQHEELLDRHKDSFVDEAYKERNQELTRAILNGDINHYSQEIKYSTAKEHERWGRLTATSIFDESGEVRFGIEIIEDITEQKQKESHIKELAQVIKESHHEIYIFDADTLTFEMVSKGAVSNLGYSESELLQLTPLALKKDFEREAFRALLEECRQNPDQVCRFDTMHYRKNGDSYSVIIELQPISYLNKEAFVAYVTDISELKAVESELRSNEARLKQAQKIAKIGDWRYNLETDTVTWSKATYEIYGRDPELGPIDDGSFSYMVHDEDRDRLQSAVDRCIDGQCAFQLEYEIEDGKGKRKFVEVHGLPDLDEEGNLLGMIGTVQDITQSKQAEMALASQRDRLDAVIRGTNVGTWTWNVQSGEVTFNERWAEMIGYTLDELEEGDITIKTWEKYCHPEDLEQSGELLTAHFEGETDFYEIEARMKHKEGHWVWILDRGKVFEWTADGKPLMMHGTHQDISRRKEREEEIARQARFLENVNNNLPDVVYQFKIDTDGNYSFEYLSEGYEKMTGQPPHTVIENFDLGWELVHPDDRDDILREIEESAKTMVPFSYEYRQQGPNNTLKWIQATSTPYRNEDGSIIWTGVFHDVTERKRYEEELKKLSMVANRVQNSVVITDEKARTIWVNESFTQMTGYTLKEVEGKSLGQYLQGEDTNPEDAYAIKQGLEKREPFTQEILNYNKSGEAYWNELIITPIFDENGELIQFFGIQNDITERKQAEQQLVESEKRLKNISNSVPGALLRYKVNSDGTDELLFISKQVKEIWGVGAEEAMEDVSKLWDKIDEAYLPQVQASVAESAKNLTFWEDIWPVHLPGKQVKWLNGRGTPQLQEDGSVIWDSLIFDITEQKQAEMELQYQQELFRELFEHMNEGCAIFEAVADGENFRIKEYNRGSERIDRVSNSDAVGSLITETFPSVVETGLLSEMQRVWQTGDSIHYRAIHKEDDQLEFIQDNYVYKLATGELVVIYEDITDRVLSQEKLRTALDKFESLVNTVNGVVFEADPETFEFAFVSEQASEILGYGPEELQQDPELWASRIHPDDKDETLAKCKAEIDSGNSFAVEYRFKRKDGRLIWVRDHMTLRSNKQGDVSMMGLMIDITESKTIQLELAESEELYKSILNSMSEGLVVHKLDDRVIANNVQASEILGLTEEQLMGKSSFDPRWESRNIDGSPMEPTDHPSVITNRTGKSVKDKLMDVRKANGDRAIISVNSQPLKDYYGEQKGAVVSFTDVTKEYEAREALAASEERYRNISDNLPGMIFRYVMHEDGSDEILYTSEGVEEIYEISPEEAIEDSSLIWEKIHHDDVEAVAESVQASADKLENWDHEFRILTPSGSIKWLHGIGKPMKQPDGSTLWDTITFDISEQKRAEQEIKRQEEMFRMLAESSEDVISLYEPDGTMVYVSPGAEKFTEGRVLSQGENAFSNVWDEDMPALNRALARVLNGESTTLEWRPKLENGPGQWMETFAKPILDDNGEVDKILASTRSIAERKQREAELISEKELLENLVEERTGELRVSEELHRNLFKNMYQGVVYLDGSGNMLNANESFSRILKLSSLDLKAMKITDLDFKFYAEQLDRYLDIGKEIQSTIESGLTVRYFSVKLTRNSDQHQRWINLAILPIQDIEGTDARAYCIFEDITVLKQIQQKLVDARKDAVEISKVKQQFMANMSHEIRTPIHGIQGMIHLMADTELSKEQQEYVEAVKQSSYSLLTVINDILDMSKLERGIVNIEQAPFQIDEVLDSVQKMFQVKIQESGVDFSVSIANGVPETVKGDRARLQQIMLNLVGNALKFTHDGSVKVRVHAGPRDGDTQPIRFEVIDSGIGIKPDKLEKIFEAFAQENVSITKMYGGTGLGLAITKKLVELQNGSIKVQSEKNRGTTFTVEIPYAVATRQDQTRADTTAEIHSLEACHILVVDDNKVNLLWSRKLLESWDAEVMTADGGMQAIELIQEHAYDIVLMDIQMPDTDGYDTTRFIRQNLDEPKSSVPIIGVSADVMQGQYEKCISAGMDDYIGKPFKPAELNKMIIKTIQAKTNINLMQPEQEEPSVNGLPSFEHINPDKLDEVAEDDIAFKKDITENFLSIVEDTIEKLPEAIEQGDVEAVGKLAHRIKPNCQYFGMSLYGTALRLNKQSKVLDQMTEEYKMLSRDLLDALKESLEELHTLHEWYSAAANQS